MEARDEQQIIQEYEGKVLKEITYKVQGQTAISYNGIKFIVGKLGHIKVLPESIKAEYIEKPEQMWVASVVAINEKYGIQLPGAGEQPYLMLVKGEMKPDPFSRRKAISKATRNALRAVIPEQMIIKFLEDAEKGSSFNPPNPAEVRREVENFNETVKKNKATHDASMTFDLSIDGIKGALEQLGYNSEMFEIRHDEPTRMYVIDKKPWIDGLPEFNNQMRELGGEYNAEYKKTVFKY